MVLTINFENVLMYIDTEISDKTIYGFSQDNLFRCIIDTHYYLDDFLLRPHNIMIQRHPH